MLTVSDSVRVTFGHLPPHTMVSIQWPGQTVQRRVDQNGQLAIDLPAVTDLNIAWAATQPLPALAPRV